ncbi:Alpha/Beta hydrolase protein [Hygrophoropsis aurantiaca]|uniref:Alpha/Beta hydrolase protein n=1 Tax=Hygrophoropsis aurantiaca TaxID=72124 RepID=A0ACB8AS16_9AGAM|nr:Alpha/Beta hydrolase protein [Hygrophoropsis aurantiaca]
MLLETLVLLFFGALCANANTQTPFTSDLHSAASSTILAQENNITLQLNSITSEETFVALSHPRFPNHSVRIKKSTFCDPTVSVYTGYLDVDEGAKHLFFYFFESRRDPAKDDVMMWINGGPGCSSGMGLLFELGPCSIDMTKASPNGTNWNPYSWNKEANIFFLDQPVGVGYSYADFGETVETTEEAARNVHAFITIFFETFKQFAGRSLHLAGESYGGRYLPVFASEIYDKNKVAESEGRPSLNLKSIMIGNGITDISTLYEGRYQIECGTAALDVPFQQISTCVRIKSALPRCQALMRNSCIDQFDHMNCGAAVQFCDNEMTTAYWASGRNVYDVSMVCKEQDLCYPDENAVADFLDLTSTRQMLGAESPGKFTVCSNTVGRNFVSHLDKWAHHTQHYVAELLERDIRVLIYAGTYDYQCNWIANKLWVDKLEWSGRTAYAGQTWRDWLVDGHTAGATKKAGGLTFATILGAGHMVPHDKPAEAQAMVSRWLANQDI